jgi:hydrogenase maturation protease
LKKSTLILGVGNEILKDDGIGPKIVSRLVGEYPASNFDYQTASLGGLELVELIRGYQRVILIDAINTGQGQVGDVSFFTPQDFKETLHLSNLHDVSFLQALELGKHINIPIPADIIIIAIEIREDKVFGEEFTPELQNQYEQIYQSIKQFLESIRA